MKKSLINKKIYVFVLLQLLITFTFCTLSNANNIDDKKTSYPDPKRWSRDARNFDHWDRKNAYPANAVLFVGSSSIGKWFTAQAFPDYPVINRGFGGSIMADSVYYAEPFVLKYNPKLVVVYAGDNDCAVGISPDSITRDFSQLADKIHDALPKTEIIILSVKLADARKNLWSRMRQVNKRYEQYAQSKEYITYVDVDTVLRQNNGAPDPTYYSSDQLHLSEKGYAVWNKLLLPVIKERYSLAMNK